jgi:hypothetical protein
MKMNSSSSNSGNNKKKGEGLVILLRFSVASFIIVFCFLALRTLLLSSKFQLTSAIEISLHKFETGKNETPLQSGPIVTEKIGGYQPSIYKLLDRSIRIEIPDSDRKLAFVHVGKSGGSTISLLLRNGCISATEGKNCEPERWKKFPGKVGENETIASQRVLFYLHSPHVESGKMAEYYSRVSSIVVVARDPLDRWISAFLSRHPANIDAMRRRIKIATFEAKMNGIPIPIWAQKRMFGFSGARNDQIHRVSYSGCYPNVQEFVNCATDAPIERDLFHTTIRWVKRGTHSESVTLNCRQICREIAAATGAQIHHIRYNYECEFDWNHLVLFTQCRHVLESLFSDCTTKIKSAYLKDLPYEREVFVIRTEKLWQDWVTVNNLLGSPNDVPIPESINEGEVVNSQGNLPVKSNLNRNGRDILCTLLLNEYIHYINLLNRAVNLSDDDVKSKLEDIHRKCPALFANGDI